jgi:hypothetical protein
MNHLRAKQTAAHLAVRPNTHTRGQLTHLARIKVKESQADRAAVIGDLHQQNAAPSGLDTT